MSGQALMEGVAIAALVWFVIVVASPYAAAYASILTGFLVGHLVLRLFG